ncbi:hypothetical protein [Dactylosporangium salmoneum]|uniref:Secreted protein n=1 Tax=Dactylosporangium salmoneum TaxID=53361 RepID=A0ABP5SA20_9ACTN
MAWRVVRSLEKLNTQVRASAPRAVPPATPTSAWGSIGDTLHTSTSDHSPHVYPVLGTTPVVCARDFPHAPALGLDGAVYTETLRLSRDPRIGYVIFNRRIFSGHPVDGVPAFTWRSYSGSDPHDTHWHVSSVYTALADDERPWAIPGAPIPSNSMEDDMAVIAKANSGQLYFCIGGFSHPINAGDVSGIRYLAGQGVYQLANNAGSRTPDNAEWEAGGWIRKGWSEAVFGPIYTKPAPAPPIQLDSAALTALTAQILQAVGGELAAVRAAVEAQLSPAERAAIQAG